MNVNYKTYYGKSFNDMMLTFRNRMNAKVRESFSNDEILKYRIQCRNMGAFGLYKFYRYSNTSTKYLMPKCFNYNIDLKLEWVHNKLKTMYDNNRYTTLSVAYNRSKESDIVQIKAIDVFTLTEDFQDLVLHTLDQVDHDDRKLFTQYVNQLVDILIYKIKAVIKYTDNLHYDEYAKNVHRLNRLFKCSKVYRNMAKELAEVELKINDLSKSPAQIQYKEFVHKAWDLMDHEFSEKIMRNPDAACQKYSILFGTSTKELFYEVMRYRNMCSLTLTDLGVLIKQLNNNCCVLAAYSDSGAFGDIFSPVKYHEFIVIFTQNYLFDKFIREYYKLPKECQSNTLHGINHTVKHEIGHILADIDNSKNGKTIFEVRNFDEKDVKFHEEYNKRIFHMQWSDSDVIDYMVSYYDIPNEKLANEYGGVDIKEYEQYLWNIAKYRNSKMNSMEDMNVIL